MTNTPWHHHLKDAAFRCSAMAEGFQLPDFKIGATFPNLRAAIEARKRHIEMYELMRSIREFTDIPSTFDGEIPEFAFGEETRRLIIGQRYLVQVEDGTEQPALLTAATVVEAERTAYCGLSFENGKSTIHKCPLSDAEMTAWRRHPDTFFGQIGQCSTEAKDPLELYDFFHNSYRNTSREQLLELMVGSHDIERLRKLDQPTLASIYAERCVNSAIASM